MTKILNSFLKPNDIYETLKPTLFITYICGLTPFRIYGHGDKKSVKASKLGFLNGVLHACFFFMCFLVTIINGETFIQLFFNTDISKLGDLLQKFTGIIGMTVLFSTSLYYRGTLMNLIKLLNKIDQELLDLGVLIDYKYILNSSFLCLIIIISINTIFVSASLGLLMNVDARPTIFSYFSFFPPHFFVGYVLQLFLTFVFNIKTRYEALNKILTNLLATSSPNKRGKNSNKTINTSSLNIGNNSLKALSLFKIASKSNEELLDGCMDVHALICEATSMTNEFFKYQLLTIISMAFLIIVFDAYYMLEAIFGPKENHTNLLLVEFLTFFSSQLFLFISSIMAMVEFSSNAIHQNKQTGPLVHKLLNHMKDNGLKQKLLYFSMQLTHQNVKFTAAGIFDVDRPLYLMMCGSATTYLIILLQFATNGD